MINITLTTDYKSYSSLPAKTNQRKFAESSFVSQFQYDVFQPSFKSSKYRPVATLAEAQQYAAKNLGVKKFNVDDIDIANWINECLLHNKDISNGVSTALGEVTYIDFDKINKPDNVLAVMYTYSKINPLFPSKVKLSHKLCINKKYIKNLGKNINDLKRELLNTGILRYGRHGLKFNDNYTTENYSKYEKLLNTNLLGMTIEEKLELDTFLWNLKDYSDFKIDVAYDSLKKILNNRAYRSKLGNLQVNGYMNSYEIFNLLNKIEKKLGIKHDIKIEGKYKVINHEIGHMLHAENDYQKYNKPDSRLKHLFKSNLYTASRVSQYAQANMHEYVAEVYAKLASGLKMPKVVMDLYYQFGGPKVNI